MKEKNKLVSNILLISGILILIVLEYLVHHKCVFIMDDLWYSTNLSTGHPLSSFGDVLESQVWHFFNWGGRNITHGILQLTLMSGETIANILNLVMMLLLVWMICVLSGHKNPLWYLLSASLVVSCNPNIKDSMFWQSGTVNYVYSTAWILFFLWVYLRETSENTTRKLPLTAVWIIPLGLITGWSNENMGPASFVISVAVILYVWKVLKRKPPVWMYLGSLFSLIGSGLVILSPGNFVRTAELPETALGAAIGERIINMLRAGADYLFPSALLMLVTLFIYVAVFNNKLKPFQWFLMAHAILSYGAMALSPHYPDRATFGTMCVFILLTVSMLGEILFQKKIKNTYMIYIFVIGIWLYSAYKLILYIL